jgi:hypothetical protein
LIADWWQTYMVVDLVATLKAMLIGVGAAAVLLLLARWLMRAGGPFNK